MKHYLVITPEFGGYGFYSYEAYEPPEEYCAVVAIEAENKKEAKSLALRTKELAEWVDMCRGDGVSPYTGLRVEEGQCPHGFCVCGCQTDECEACINETTDLE